MKKLKQEIENLKNKLENSAIKISQLNSDNKTMKQEINALKNYQP